METFEDSEDLDYSEQEYYNTGTPNEEEKTILKQLFNTEIRTELLRRSLRGETPKGDGTWQKLPKELAGDTFVNKQICSFRSIVNETNSFTKKDDKECKRILKDAVDAFILDMYNDETIETKDMRTLAKMYEHALELFLGLVEFGHGARVLISAINGQKYDMSNNKEKKNSFGEWLNPQK